MIEDMAPIVHAAASWLLAQGLPSLRDRRIVTAAGLAPDLDGLAAVLGVDAYHEYHHTFGHNVFMAVAAIALSTVLAVEKRVVAILALASFHLHLVMDAMGSGSDWPIKYFWPVSMQEFRLPDALTWEFVGAPNTVVGIVLMGAVVVLARIRGRSLVEVVSVRADGTLCREIAQPVSVKLAVLVVAIVLLANMCTMRIG
jgi:hypothetical protein